MKKFCECFKLQMKCEDYVSAVESSLTLINLLPEYQKWLSEKTTENLTEAKSINLKRTNKELDYEIENGQMWRKGLEECSEKLDLDLELMRSQAEKATNELKENMLSTDYPMIYFYTSSKGFAKWFRRSNLISLYPEEFRRSINFCDIGTSLRREEQSFVKLIEDYNLPVKDKNSARLKLVAIYRNCMVTAAQLLLCEIEKLSLCCPDIHYGSETVVYRGESMKIEDFQKLKKKLKKAENQQMWQVICERYCSTSKKTIVANNFSKSISKKRSVNLLHQYHLVNIKDEEIRSFKDQFPNQEYIYQAVPIKEYSAFKSEDEVLLWYPNGVTLGIYEEKNDNGSTSYWYLDHVSTGLKLQDCRSYDDLRYQNEDYSRSLSLKRSGEDPEALIKHYKRFPQQRAYHYFEYLCMVTCYRFAKEYFHERGDSKKSQYIERNILKPMEEKLTFLKEIEKYCRVSSN